MYRRSLVSGQRRRGFFRFSVGLALAPPINPTNLSNVVDLSTGSSGLRTGTPNALLYLLDINRVGNCVTIWRGDHVGVISE